MILGSYKGGDSVIHRLWPGAKLLALCAVGTLLFAVSSPLLALVALIAVAALFPLAGLRPGLIVTQLRPVLWVFGLILVSQVVLGQVVFGVLLVLRLASLVLLAALVTLTTRASDMVDALVRGFSVLRPFGVNPRRLGLALSLSLRFLPVIARMTAEVREAQHARGQGTSIFATAIPTLVRTLKMAAEIAEAIEARGFED